MSFFTGQAVTYRGRLYRIEDIVTSQKKGVSYKIAGFDNPVPAYINGEYAGLQLGEVHTIFVKENDIQELKVLR